MNLRNLALVSGLAVLGLSVGCIRSYNVTPLSPASLNTELKTTIGVEVRTKGFLDAKDVSEKFGTKLANDRQVVPVQVQINNKGPESYKVLRANFVLLETGQNIKLDSLSNEQIYELGRHGYVAPVCGVLFGGILGLPSLITTMNSNDRLRDDYNRKLLSDTILDPGKEASGVVFFDPAAKNLQRSGKYKLVVELLNTTTNAKSTVEQILN